MGPPSRRQDWFQRGSKQGLKAAMMPRRQGQGQMQGHQRAWLPRI